jgi:hypothetical protein
MSRRRAVAFIWLLLPLMVLRAWLPAGYMPVAGEAGMRLVLCSGAILDPAAGGTPATTDAHDADLSCPFAHAPALAPPLDFSLAPAFTRVVAPGAASPTLSQQTTGPPRANPARGPPQHS